MNRQANFIALSANLCLLVVVFFFQGCGQFTSRSADGVTGLGSGAVLPSKSKVRLLNAGEYMQTMNSLTGYAVTSDYSHEDKSAGYTTGDRLQVEASLFESFYNDAQSATQAYLQGKGLTDYPCLSDPGEDCYSRSMLGFAEKAFRRPLSSEQIAELSALKTELDGLETLDASEKFQLLLTRILVSPSFLYRMEYGYGQSSEGIPQLDAFEKASFISYTLTGDAPDEELYAVAKNGELVGDNISTQVQRLLNSEKAQDHLVSFFKDWLHLDNLDSMATNPDQFTKFESLEVGPALKQEFSEFIKQVVFNQKGSLVDLMTTRETFANQHTASFYGASASGDAMTAIDMGPNRSGILTLASVMSSHGSRTTAEVDNPAQRGIVLKERLLCETVGIPSGLDTATASENILERFPEFESLPIRRQSEIVMNQGESCIQCHAQFMPLGYVFSKFDASGQFQQTQRGEPINSSVTVIVDGRSADFEGASDFLPDLATEPLMHKCFSQQMASFVSGSAEESGEGNLKTLFHQHLQAEGLGIASALAQTLSDPKLFQRRREQ